MNQNCLSTQIFTLGIAQRIVIQNIPSFHGITGSELTKTFIDKVTQRMEQPNKLHNPSYHDNLPYTSNPLLFLEDRPVSLWTIQHSLKNCPLYICPECTYSFWTTKIRSKAFEIGSLRDLQCLVNFKGGTPVSI